MAVNPNPPVTPPETPAAPEAPAMRELDEAVGGGQVPVGVPLGGPVFKTNDQLNAERIEQEEAKAAEEKAAAEAAPEPPPALVPATENPLS